MLQNVKNGACLNCYWIRSTLVCGHLSTKWLKTYFYGSNLIKWLIFIVINRFTSKHFMFKLTQIFSFSFFFCLYLFSHTHTRWMSLRGNAALNLTIATNKLLHFLLRISFDGWCLWGGEQKRRISTLSRKLFFFPFRISTLCCPFASTFSASCIQ